VRARQVTGLLQAQEQLSFDRIYDDDET
jgi:hypothetical protein